MAPDRGSQTLGDIEQAPKQTQNKKQPQPKIPLSGSMRRKTETKSISTIPPPSDTHGWVGERETQDYLKKRI